MDLLTKVVRVEPLEANLKLVVLDQFKEVRQESLALIFCNIIDVGDVASDGVDALPSRDGVGADNRVDCLELAADIFGGSTLFLVQGEASALCDIVEGSLLGGCRQALEKFLEWRADAIVHLVATGPQCVWVTPSVGAPINH
jgi:hypothetical protein